MLKSWRSDQETSEEELFIKTWQQSQQKDFYQDLMLDSIEARQNQTFQFWLHAYAYVFV